MPDEPYKFQEGHDPRRGDSVFPLMEKRKAVPEVKPEDDGAAPELMAMRHVNLNPKRYDITEPQLAARKFKEKDPKAFWQLLAELEKRHKDAIKEEAKELAAAKAKRKEEREAKVFLAEPAPAEDFEYDTGTAKCLALAEKLLTEIGEP